MTRILLATMARPARVALRTAFLGTALICTVPALAQDGNAAAGDGGPSGLLPLESADLRTTVSEQLQQTLYDLQALKHNTHQAHWNVIGSDFYQLHEFYGELYAGLGGFIDSVAERIRAVGVAADGRPGAIAESTEIEPIATGELQGDTTNEFLARNWKSMSDRLYASIEATSDEPVTQDLLISVAHFVDKGLWQLRAHTL